ncbi:hypothetical protein SCHPADRAFT_911988, partial [Schizopora paradoxa]
MMQILTDARYRFITQHLRAFLDIAEASVNTTTKHVRSTRITVRFTGVEKDAQEIFRCSPQEFRRTFQASS